MGAGMLEIERVSSGLSGEPCDLPNGWIGWVHHTRMLRRHGRIPVAGRRYQLRSGGQQEPGGIHGHCRLSLNFYGGEYEYRIAKNGAGGSCITSSEADESRWLLRDQHSLWSLHYAGWRDHRRLLQHWWRLCGHQVSYGWRHWIER